MEIKFTYSHLNGLEWLMVHHPNLLEEIKEVIKNVDAKECKTKTSKEKTMKWKVLYSPIDMNTKIKKEFEEKGWNEKRYAYYVTDDEELTRKIVNLSDKEQREKIEESWNTPIASYHQTDFTKNRVAIEVQFGKYPFIEFDLFVKHLGFFVWDKISLWIEIIPTKRLQSMMSSWPWYYERTLAHILRQWKWSPSVPLIIFWIE